MPKAQRNRSSGHLPEFSLSKLHRILRPLRSKTISLSKALEQSPAQDHLRESQRAHTQADYTSSPTSSDERSLPSSSEPDGAGSDQRFKPHPVWWKYNLYDMETAVIEAFGTLVLAVHSSPTQRLHPQSDFSASRRLRSLTELSAFVLGAQIEASVAATVTDDHIYIPTFGVFDTEDEGVCRILQDEAEGEEAAVLVDMCYENIPQHLRAPAIIPHAIQMVDRLLPMSSIRVFGGMIQVCAQYSLSDEARLALGHTIKRVLCATAGMDQHILDVDCKKETLTKLLEYGRSFSTNLLWTEEEFVRMIRRTIHDPELGQSSNPSSSMVWKCVPWLTRGLHRLFHSLTSPAAKQLLCETVISGCVRIIPPSVTGPWETNRNQGYLLPKKDEEPNLIQQAEFMNMLSSQFERLPRWCTALIKTDLSLPPDDEMDNDEELPTVYHWAVRLVQTATAMLTLSEPPSPTKTLRPAALSLALHALIRSSSQDSLAKEQLLCAVSRSFSKFSLSDSDLKPLAQVNKHTFHPLFSTLHSEPPYFHSALMEYHDFLKTLQSRKDGRAFASFRVLFLRSAVSFIQLRTQGHENGFGQDFFIHDEDRAELEDKLRDAEAAMQEFAHQGSIVVSGSSPSSLMPNSPVPTALKRRSTRKTANQPPTVHGSTSTRPAANRKRKLEVYVEIPWSRHTSKEGVSLSLPPTCRLGKRPRTNARIPPGSEIPKLAIGTTKSPPQVKNNDAPVHHLRNPATRRRMARLTSMNSPTGTIPKLPFPPPVLTSILLAHMPNASNSLSAEDSGSGQKRDCSICPTTENRLRKNGSSMKRRVRHHVSEESCVPNRPSRNKGTRPENNIINLRVGKRCLGCDKTMVPSQPSHSGLEPDDAIGGAPDMPASLLRQDGAIRATSASRVRSRLTQESNPPNRANPQSIQKAATFSFSNDRDPPSRTRARSTRKTDPQSTLSNEHDPLDLFHVPGSASRSKSRRFSTSASARWK